MGVSLVNAAILAIAFRGKTERQLLGSAVEKLPADSGHLVERELGGEEQPLLPGKKKAGPRGSSQKVKMIFSSRTVWATFGWVFFYVSACGPYIDTNGLTPCSVVRKWESANSS